LRALRVEQWVKNILVVAAPAAAGVLDRPAILTRTGIAAGIFVVASAGTYLINDVQDAARDRMHPRKRLRPVASGELSARSAFAVGVPACLLAAGAALWWNRQFGLSVTAYVVLTSLYSWRLKRVPVLEMMVVAAGFLLRAIAGGVVNNLPLSNWFMLVSASGALFLVSAKRQAEQRAMREHAGDHRAVIAQYPPEWIQQTISLSLTATVLGYCLWAFQYLGHDVIQVLLALSVAPFTALLLRYTLLASQGHGERPERLLLTDPFLIIAAATCAVLLFCGLYLA
jgi:decaprenyl-phosphate phosphoribosyltransferase